MYLITGLGNPGKEYALTRHNVGFMAIDELSDMFGVSSFRSKFNSLYAEVNIRGERAIIQKPLTYMNNSGQAVRAIADYYKIPHENIIVLLDDVDISFGALRIRKNGSAGTHNGMKSIIFHLSDDNFPRIKIGVGNKRDGEDLADFVLGRFSSEEFKTVEETVKRAAEAAVETIVNGADSAMNKFNIKK